MASLQHRISSGHKYWYIVESRRVNGKPRPIPLLYLGKADDILKRLQGGICKNIKCKSFSHGAVAALLRVVDDIGVIDIINKYVPKNKKNGKQLRDGLTVGGSLTLRAIEKNLKKKSEKLDELNKSLSNPRCKKRTRKDIIESIKGIVKGQFVQDIITWKLPRKRKYYRIEYGVDDTKFEELKKYRLGYRILMTDRHEWTDKEIMAAYHGQSKVEYAFKNLENPYHGSAHPQFHWTDQKIRVHVFTCVLGFLFESVIYRKAQKKKYGQTNYDNLFDRLERIRLAALIEDRGKRKQMDVHYTLEETEPEDELLLDALGIRDFHIKRPRFKDLVVYK